MADIDQEWDKVRGEIKVLQKTKARQAKDAASGQMSLFPVEEIKGPRNDPNKEAMERIAREKDDAKDKAKSKAAENEDFKDKRQPKSDLIRQAELEKMKEILNKPKGGGGGGGGMGGNKLSNRDLTKNYKAGGKVKSASARADGCCIRGKTRA
jgi:hypothetical protein